MAGELTELGLRLRGELEEMLAAPASGWVLVPALDERGDLAQLRELEREVGALAASEADAGQLYAWLTAGFFGEPLARGSVADAGAREPLSDDGDEPPEDTDGPGGGGGGGGSSPSIPPVPGQGAATAPASPPPPLAPSAPALAAPTPPARPGIKGLAELAAVARSAPLVLPPSDEIPQPEWPVPQPPTANGVIRGDPGADSPPPRGGWAPLPLSDDGEERRPASPVTTADIGLPRSPELPRSSSLGTPVAVRSGGARPDAPLTERWAPPSSGAPESVESERTVPGATPDVRRSQSSVGEPVPPPSGGLAARGLAGLAALAGSRPLVLADEWPAPGVERGTSAERAAEAHPASPRLPAPPAPVAGRGREAAASEGPARVVRILPLPTAVAEERASRWPAVPPAEGWTPPFAEAPAVMERETRTASPSPSPASAPSTGWDVFVAEGDSPRSPRLAPMRPARGTHLAAAVAAFAPVEGQGAAGGGPAMAARAGEARGSVRQAPLPEMEASPAHPALPGPVPPEPAAPPVFSTTLSSPAREAREGFGATQPGEPPAWPDVEVEDLMEALAREIMHEYRRHYGA